MAITSGLCISAKLDLLNSLRGDDIRIALYGPSANLSPYTEKYTTEGEVKGQGYQAGGMSLQGFQSGTDGVTACATWTGPVIWKNATISAYGALIYNYSQGNKTLTVIGFDKPITSTNGNFKVDLPPLTATEALIWIA